jgi:hypothetical protein
MQTATLHGLLHRVGDAVRTQECRADGGGDGTCAGWGAASVIAVSDDGPGHYNPDPSEGPWGRCERSLIRRASTLTVELERMEATFAKDGEASAEDLGTSQTVEPEWVALAGKVRR